MEVRRLAGPLGDLVDVEIERARCGRVQRDGECGLLVCLPQCSGLEREVRRLDVAARLQQTVELDVLYEARARACLVDDECRGSEVRARLSARERVVELVREVTRSSE